MKKYVLSLSFVFMLSFFSFAQNPKTGDDLVLVKPIINIDEENGGYFSHYVVGYYADTCELYFSVIVKNLGQVSATNIIFTSEFIDFDDDGLMYSVNSETLASLGGESSDTISLSNPLFVRDLPSIHKIDSIIFTVSSDMDESNIMNNTYSIPFPKFAGSYWSEIGRTDNPGALINLDDNGFGSGDFFGIRMFTQDYHTWWGALGYILPPSLNFIDNVSGQLYENGELVYSWPIQPAFSGGWEMFMPPNFSEIINAGSTYYWGLSFEYDAAENDLLVPGDTLSFHNFEHETIAKVNGEWTSLDFVPAIRLFFNTEVGIEDSEIDKSKIYPNPAKGILTIENIVYEHLEVIDINGKIVYSKNFDGNNVLDVSFLQAGIYIIRLRNDNDFYSKEFVIRK